MRRSVATLVVTKLRFAPLVLLVDAESVVVEADPGDTRVKSRVDVVFSTDRGAAIGTPPLYPLVVSQS